MNAHKSPILKCVALLAVCLLSPLVCHLPAQTTNTFPTTGNAGIGTTTPGASLDIVGTSAPSVRIGNGTGQYSLKVGAVSGSDGLFSIYDGVNHTNRMTVDPSGNIGIGTSSPIAQLDLSGAAYKLSSSSAVKEIPLFFPDGANERIDIYFGPTGAGNSLWGYVDAELTDTYHGENDDGLIHKRFYIGVPAHINLLIRRWRSKTDAIVVKDVRMWIDRRVGVDGAGRRGKNGRGRQDRARHELRQAQRGSGVRRCGVSDHDLEFHPAARTTCSILTTGLPR